MKITVLVLISVLSLFSTFVQNSEGWSGPIPVGKRALQRKVCTFGIIYKMKTKTRTKNERIALEIQFVSVLMCLLKREKSSINTSKLCIMCVTNSWFKGIENSTKRNK